MKNTRRIASQPAKMMLIIVLANAYFLLLPFASLSQTEKDHYLEQALLKDSLKDYPGAIQQCDLVIHLNPAHAKAWYLRGKAKYCLHDYTGAIQDEQKAVRSGLRSENTFLVSAYARMALKDYKAAVLDFDKAIALNAENGASYYHRGFAKARLKDKGARADFSKAIELGNAKSGDLLSELSPE